MEKNIYEKIITTFIADILNHAQCCKEINKSFYKLRSENEGKMNINDMTMGTATEELSRLFNHQVQPCNRKRDGKVTE